MTEPRQSRAPRKQTTQPRAAFTPPPPLSSGDLKAPVSDQSSRDSAKGLHVVDVRARVPGTGSLVTDFQSPKLEAVYLERRVVKSLLIQVYGLGVYGFGHSDSVQLHKTSDGVQITRSDTWSAQGVHVVDVRARVPGTGNSVTDFQSPKHHYMTGVAVAPEKSTTCENMDVEAAFFADSRELQETGVLCCDVLKRDVHISESNSCS
jgi:hypothetical protein